MSKRLLSISNVSILEVDFRNGLGILLFFCRGILASKECEKELIQFVDMALLAKHGFT